MSITVDPDQLLGYAKQLERNAGYFVAPLRGYCAAHCSGTTGMTGLLAAARPAVDLAAGGTADLFTAAERNLLQLVTNLRAAAAGYRSGDAAVAERIWSVLPRRPAPAGYVDRDDGRHPGDFRDPFVPGPAPPVFGHEATGAAEEVRHRLGVVDEWLRRYTHVSLGEQVLPWLAGDWDVLRAAAGAYAALAGPDGVQAIRANLAYGMDSLSTAWDSPAATRFGYAVRECWLPGLDALQRLLALHREALEFLAQQSENTLHALVLAIEAAKLWVIEKVLRIVVSPLGAELTELVTGVLRAWHHIKTLLEALRLTFDGVRQAMELAGAEAASIEDLLAGRLEPVVDG